jgi:hypothetical protein
MNKSTSVVITIFIITRKNFFEALKGKEEEEVYLPLFSTEF